MDFFTDLGKLASDAAVKTVQQTRKLSEAAKLTLLISEEKRKTDELYRQLGKKYAELHKEDPEEELEGLLRKIRAGEAKAEEYQTELLNQKGLTRCKQCGAEISDHACFCQECGAPVERPQEEEVPAEEEVEEEVPEEEVPEENMSAEEAEEVEEE